MTLIQAQQRLIERINNCHPGHQARVRRSAIRDFRRYLLRTKTPPGQIADVIRDALDMAKLEARAEA